MNKIKSLFGNVNLTYKKLIILSIIIGVVVGLLNSVPFLNDTTVSDVASIYGFWILCGIFIIMNSKSNLDSAIKCFLFFLISQPLIYLVEVPFNSMGWGLFVYYPFWFKLTILCFPMGYIGYFIKKDKWYGLLILIPILILLDSEIVESYKGLTYVFPHHLINFIMTIFTSILYPLVLFKNKIIKYIGLSIDIIIILFFFSIAVLDNNDYETTINCSTNELYYDNNYKAYLKDNKYGEVNIYYSEAYEAFCVNAKFHKKGNTKLIIEDTKGNKKEYDLSIGKDTYDLDVN